MAIIGQQWQNVTIVRIEVEGFTHTRGFDEVVTLLLAGFDALGISASVAVNQFSAIGVNVALGAHVLSRLPALARPDFPPNTVIFNLEQVDPASPWIDEYYVSLLRSHPVWDYSSANVARLASQAVESLRRNTSAYADRVEILNVRGDELPPLSLDLVISIGVIHHIPDPNPVMKAAYAALKPGGQVLLWLYGREGNELYLSIFGPLRAITRGLPHFLLVPLAHALNVGAGIYLSLARILPLPMRDYVINIFGQFDRHVRYLVVYDQLNPAYAKYLYAF